ncbi:hypothetical protein BJP40_20910 [Streptomyces sp. CC53]|uniref:ATP-binding protein n=1 Tax=unclassified Streptomyces TaxID=2593676 RepID=UPI0008DDF194|nr:MULTISPECIES: ATP-binding protein [unclassified Streptomyces]OII64225.1 hypothetical protein BJP40_20910 [Streptomyces sp. CC53]OII67726.1 hypothetical protein BJP39_23970 [Streptomyces sp. CC77]
MYEDGCVCRRPWELPFRAEPKEVAGLRRIVRLHLTGWGLARQVEAAQLCVSELVTNVIRHVGTGTPTVLRFSMNGTSLRIEVRDPEPTVLPRRVPADRDAESGRGMALVDAVADCWGTLLDARYKTTWCEIPTDLSTSDGHGGGVRVSRAEGVLSLYETAVASSRAVSEWEPRAVPAKDMAAEAMVDLLHWMCAHGFDADDVLDGVRTRFESGL